MKDRQRKKQPNKKLRIVELSGEFWVVKGLADEKGTYPYYSGPYQSKNEAEEMKSAIIRMYLVTQIGL